MTYKVIRYSIEHIHIIKRATLPTVHIHEQCILSRNWNRCTAPEATLDDYRNADSRNRSYYNGSGWARADKNICALGCSLCYPDN